MRFSRQPFAAAGAALGTLVLLAASPVGAAPRPDAPDQAAPFLRAPARTIPALVREVRRDPAARARYAAFFQIAPGETLTYLKTQLTPGVIPATAPYTVYFLSHKGTVYPVWLTLPAGTRVFYGPHRAPVLLCNSGDPMALPLWASAPVAPHGKVLRSAGPKSSVTASAAAAR